MKRNKKRIKKSRTLADVRIANVLQKVLEGLDKTIALMKLEQLDAENVFLRAKLDCIKVREQTKVEEL